MNPLDAAAIAIVCLWFVGLLLMTWLFFFYEHHGDSYPLRILRARSNPRLGNSDPENRPCAICLDVLKTPVMLECKHIFCKECTEKWLSTKASCPTCRKTVPWPCKMWRSVKIGLMIFWTGCLMLVLVLVRFRPDFMTTDQLWWKMVLLMLTIAVTVMSFTATTAMGIQWIYTARETESPLAI